jgi:hypothetical protein
MSSPDRSRNGSVGCRMAGFGPDVAGLREDNSKPSAQAAVPIARWVAVGGNGGTRPLRLPMLRNR